jgi:hypothetical protein
MDPVITPILDGQQGSEDDKAWGLARLYWVCQLRVRLGLLTGKEATEFVWGVAINKFHSEIKPDTRFDF